MKDRGYCKRWAQFGGKTHGVWTDFNFTIENGCVPGVLLLKYISSNRLITPFFLENLRKILKFEYENFPKESLGHDIHVKHLFGIGGVD